MDTTRQDEIRQKENIPPRRSFNRSQRQLFSRSLLFNDIILCSVTLFLGLGSGTLFPLARTRTYVGMHTLGSDSPALIEGSCTICTMIILAFLYMT